MDDITTEVEQQVAQGACEQQQQQQQLGPRTIRQETIVVLARVERVECLIAAMATDDTELIAAIGEEIQGDHQQSGTAGAQTLDSRITRLEQFFQHNGFRVIS